MDRRKALRNIGLSAGFMAASPGLLSLLQSCTTDRELWVPEYLTVEQGEVVSILTDVILPPSDTPSGTEVNVPEFIDKYIGNGIPEEEQKFFQWALDSMIADLKASYGDISKIKQEDLQAFLNTHLRDAYKNEDALSSRAGSYAEAMKLGESVTGDTDAINYYALKALRGFAVFGYRNSEKVGEEVLAYDPVPGVYKGCASIQDLTGGKAWSL